MNYNTLTQEQKESINPKLRKLFEGIENAKAFPEVNMYCYHIEGFQEGLKTAIKIIEKQIEFISNQRSELIYILNYSYTHFLCMRFEKEIEELKKQREHLEWESRLE